MSKQKLVVYLTYGVYVDLDEAIDFSTDEGYVLVREKAVEQMFEHGLSEVASCADAEIEDVSEEFGA
jgi:hypothetical protein